MRKLRQQRKDGVNDTEGVGLAPLLWLGNALSGALPFSHFPPAAPGQHEAAPDQHRAWMRPSASAHGAASAACAWPSTGQRGCARPVPWPAGANRSARLPGTGIQFLPGAAERKQEVFHCPKWPFVPCKQRDVPGEYLFQVKSVALPFPGRTGSTWATERHRLDLASHCPHQPQPSPAPPRWGTGTLRGKRTLGRGCSWAQGLGP